MVDLTGKSDTRDWLEWVVKNPEHLSYTANGFRRNHTPGSVARVAIEEIDRLRAEVERLEGVINHAGALACQAASPEHIRSVLAEYGAHTPTTVTPESIPDDSHTMRGMSRDFEPRGVRSHSDGNVWIKCDAPLRSPEEQFTRRMLREAIALCLFTGLPDEREWVWFKSSQKLVHLPNTGDSIEFVLDIESAKKCLVLESEDDLRIGFIPAPIWDKAWRETGMEDR